MFCCFSAIKEVEVTGEKSPESADMKKQKKLTKKKSIDPNELQVSCRDLGKADHEGWLLKKGNHKVTRSVHQNLSLRALSQKFQIRPQVC